MALLKEVFFISDIHIQKSKVFLKELKDNHSFITVAQYNKISLEKKTAIRYQHFRSFTQNNFFSIWDIDATEQMAGIFTKPI